MNQSILLILLFSTLAFSYDYYTFAIESPEIACEAHTCNTAMEGNIKGNGLNVHGLWPSAIDGNHPHDCSPNIFDESLLESSNLQFMDSHWIGLYNSTHWFRWHEYGKHGSCFQPAQTFLRSRSMQSSDQIAQMNVFFAKVKELYSKYNLESIFFPSSSEVSGEPGVYKQSYDNFMSSMQKKVGANNIINVCKYFKETQRQYIFNIEICLDLNFNAIDCSSVRSNTPYAGMCHSGQDIYSKTLAL